MVSQEIQQKGYLLGLVLNGMNKTLEITLQGTILHWQGNGQDNLIVLFISNPQKLQEKVTWTTLLDSLLLWRSSMLKFFFALPRAAYDVMWSWVQPMRKWREGQPMKYFGRSKSLPSSGFWQVCYSSRYDCSSRCDYCSRVAVFSFFAIHYLQGIADRATEAFVVLRQLFWLLASAALVLENLLTKKM